MQYDKITYCQVEYAVYRYQLYNTKVTERLDTSRWDTGNSHQPVSCWLLYCLSASSQSPSGFSSAEETGRAQRMPAWNQCIHTAASTHDVRTSQSQQYYYQLSLQCWYNAYSLPVHFSTKSPQIITVIPHDKWSNKIKPYHNRGLTVLRRARHQFLPNRWLVFRPLVQRRSGDVSEMCLSSFNWIRSGKHTHTHFMSLGRCGLSMMCYKQ